MYKAKFKVKDYNPEIKLPETLFAQFIQKPISLINKSKLSFFGEEGDITEIDWDGDQKEKLWRYNQHYFDDLLSQKNPKRQRWHEELIKDWIEKNDHNSIGWDPYPLSLRVVNWLSLIHI